MAASVTRSSSTYLPSSVRTISQQSRVWQLAKQQASVRTAVPHLRDCCPFKHQHTQEEHTIVRSSMAQSSLLYFVKCFSFNSTMSRSCSNLLLVASGLHSSCSP